MSKLIGYARVSKNEQDLNLQIDALIEAGCEKKGIFIDKISGASKTRPGLTKCLEKLKEGNTLVIWRLDRMGRSLSNLIDIVVQLNKRNIKFKSLKEGVIDTSSASGEMIFHIFSVLSQFERRLIQERTMAGLNAARARGRVGGRPAINAKDPKVIMAKKMHKDQTIPISQICDSLQISKSTFYRFLGKQ